MTPLLHVGFEVPQQNHSSASCLMMCYDVQLRIPHSYSVAFWCLCTKEDKRFPHSDCPMKSHESDILFTRDELQHS